MERRRDFQLDALRPHRIVIVFTVEAEVVHPGEVARDAGRLLRKTRDRTAHESRHHHDLEPELRDVFEFLDCFRRRMHRDTRGGRHPVRVFAENVGVVVVERAAHRAAQLVIFDMRREQPLARVQHREIEPHLVHPLVQQLRQRGGGAVERVLRRIRPPYRTRHAKFAPLFTRDMVPAEIKGRVPRALVAFQDFAAAGLADVIEERRLELDHMAVGVDNRMARACADFSRTGRIAICTAHDAPLPSASTLPPESNRRNQQNIAETASSATRRNTYALAVLNGAVGTSAGLATVTRSAAICLKSW